MDEEHRQATVRKFQEGDFVLFRLDWRLNRHRSLKRPESSSGDEHGRHTGTTQVTRSPTNPGRFSSPEGFEAEYAAVEVMLDELEGTGRSLLFTSGVGVLGSGKAELLDEESDYASWPLVARRVTTEEAVIASASRGVRSAVIRPGMVYGRSVGNGIGLYVEGAARLGIAPYLDDGDALWPMVHVDDLADLYLLALQGAALGAIVHGVMPGAVRFREIAEAAVGGLHLAGGSISWSAEQFLEAFGPAAPVLLVDQRLAPSRALEELAWRPSRPDLLYELVRGGYDGQGCSGARRLG